MILIKRLTRTHKVVSFVVFFTLLVLFCIGQLQTRGGYMSYDVECGYGEKERTKLIELTSQIHSILNSIGLQHWLMYGSIIGALRYDSPLPWDHDVDLGARREDFDKLDRKAFIETFQSAGLIVHDFILRRGSITFSKEGGKLSVDLFLFQDYNGIIWRTGAEPWLFFVPYKYYHTFPVNLIQPPLPKRKFGSIELSVPRGELEILRHLYPTNWWKIVKPKACGAL
ncbi:uncharacterized protein RP688 [Nematostella vectensis]|uniref:uncharacterized protein RP688 n=1 Tax=Nematostella vectensis TaxID=45351 RepID=UPI002076DBDB|nr:uncharacterized protein RP688 [Nematostella vectensis]